MFRLTLIISLILSFQSFSQSELEYLLSELERDDLHDTSRVKAYHDISEIYRYSDAEKAMEYAFKGLKLAKDVKWDRGELMSFNTIGQNYMTASQYDSALFYLDQANEVLERTDLYRSVTYNAYGNVYFYKSDYESALSWYLKTLDEAKAENDSSAIGRGYGNLGNVHYYLGDIPKVKDNFNKSLEIKIALKDTAGIAHTMGNMGNLYFDEHDYDSTFYYFNTSLEMFEAIGNVYGMSMCENSLGQLFLNKDELDKAEDYIKRSIEHSNMVGDAHGVMRAMHQLAPILFQRGKYGEAVQTYEEGIEEALNLGALEFVKDGYFRLSDIQEQKGQFKDALENYKSFHSWNDSIITESRNEAIAAMLTEYQTKEVEDSLRISQANEDLATVKAENAEADADRKSKQLWIAIGGLVVLTGLILLVLQFYRQKKKANILLEEKNDEISTQKDIIEEKHKEITDSIAYAKRIQAAILPPMKVVKEYLHESFILYMPKDVVAGDFYWMETLNNKVMFAAADCTGHGVPGAMVSVVCNNALNRSVREHRIESPGGILDKAREIVIQEFQKSEEEVKDGMDIALCILDGMKLEFAGAHNPLWIIRKGATEVEEIKANKQPIGKFINPEPYQSHEVQLNPGDTFYIFSDGYVDQFGGEKGKKFKAKNLKELLISNRDKPMDQQREILHDTIEKWRGQLEQVDDICMIGVRV